ncbi:MAG TPA: diacylglycerol kinase family protein [Pseudonocardiaceae bacterium]|jgi:diacylglycerol kinase family enzyme|nr:diacylglycerol kinase family protein [Pseudonocardiaceae bacterium]
MLALLVVNPQATSTTPAGRDVLAHALASDVKLEVLETTYRGHAVDAAREAAADGYDLVVVHGGDGTVNEVVNGLLTDGPTRRTPMLGVVPGGSANVFAGALGLPKDPVEATYRLLRAIESGSSRRIGLGRADDRWFTFNAGVGWDAAVVDAVDARRRKRASPTLYVRAALAAYAQQVRRPPELTMEVPGAEPAESGDTEWISIEGIRAAVVCNTNPWTYLRSRPLRLVPGCSFDTGLGVLALRSLALPTVLRHGATILRGAKYPRGRQLVRHDNVPHLRVISSAPVPIQVDGDLVGERTGVLFTAVPDALRVAV